MNKKLIYTIPSIILAITFIEQALSKSWLAIFPLIGSAAFFVSAWKLKESR